MSEIIVYAETLNPAEQKDYRLDWTPYLATGETITAVAAVWTSIAGITQVSLTHSTPNTIITLSDGVTGSRGLFSLAITTSAGREFVQAFAVDVLDPMLAGGALVVEDGTGMANADSFVTMDATDAYWASLGDDDWRKASPIDKKRALRMAAEYLGFSYRWPGQPLVTTQALCWPRAGASTVSGEAIASNSIPRAVKSAAMILAREALATDLLRQAAKDELVTEESVSVGSLSTTTKYDLGSRKGVALASFSPVDAALADLTRGIVGRAGFRSVPLVRR